ncbi:hypothetical protein HR060_03505 [Catenovulum sp. SM1970]|uniref:hypothetical protein n=1 Tax=Marinifaba aquimaris TaxID=2741323 RepID=UPI0015717EB7|nr:hypothetical protein [Marinifaba aquimaris]NTS75925.1 hypothetical protein [Marinifaba aquimaris]
MKILVLLLSFFSFSSSAHVRWFIDSSQVPDMQFPIDIWTVFISLGAFCYFNVCLWLQNKSVATPLNFQQNMHLKTNQLPWLLLVALLNLLLILGISKGEFFAPNLGLPVELMQIGMALQLAIVFATTFSIIIAAALLLLSTIVMAQIFPFIVLMDYVFELAALIIALTLIAPHLNSRDAWLGEK